MQEDKGLSIKTSGYDPILETYKKLFPDKKIERAVRLSIDERTFKDVGDRRVNAYSYVFPTMGITILSLFLIALLNIYGATYS